MRLKSHNRGNRGSRGFGAARFLLPAAVAMAAVGIALGQPATTRPAATRPASTQPAAAPATRAAITTPIWPAWPVTHPAPLPRGMEDFKTTETCKTATIALSRNTGGQTDETGYLGVALDATGGKLAVSAIAPDSPAAKAGFKLKDFILSVDGHVPGSDDDFRELVQSVVPGTVVHVQVSRAGALTDLTPFIGAVSRPMSLTNTDRPVLGVNVTENATGARITQIDQNSAAARAQLRTGDVILKVDGVALSDAVHLTDTLLDRKVNDTVSLLVQRGVAEATIAVQLLAAAGDNGAGRYRAAGVAAGGAANSTYYDRLGLVFKKDNLRLGIVGIEYPDVKHNPAITNKNWEDALFSKGTYKQTATGQAAYGSEADYYYADSYGQLKVVGNMLPWVTVSKNRMDYSQGTGTGGQDRVLLNEALNLVVARDRTALDMCDGVIFVYAGNRVQTTRDGIYWPHKSQTTIANRRMPYVIVPEGSGGGGAGGQGRGGGGGGGAGGAAQADVSMARNMMDISVICHESGHILGLPDLYAQPENPGSIGLGTWCIMSQQAGNGHPQEMCAWCKEAMGWLKPVVIDPTVKQKLVLGPVEDSPTECYKVLIKPDGSEYYLLENRIKKGYDAALPGEGLLIWRVIGGRPLLMESHGIDGPGSPQVFTTAVPYPSVSNDSFTPFTTPSSRSPLGGGNPVYITNIKRMPDGRISFWMGYEFE